MPKTFYIIDGHAQIYRAYFAPFRELTSPTGEPTKATYVFTQRLLAFIENRKPDYLAMTIDSGDETVFRKEIYPEYKANRAARPADFQPQEQRILEIVRDIGIPIFAKKGFEADDLIATMVKRLHNQGWAVVMVSTDKDLRQLINDCTQMYDPYEEVFMDGKALEDKHGYTPDEAIEIQTLIGDSTDNVPGIPGVGPKTAVKLIKQYGKAEAVLEHLEDLTPKMRENFVQYASRIPMARQLVTLKNDVAFEFDPERCRFDGVKWATVKPHLRTLGFNSLLRQAEEKEQQAVKMKPAKKAALMGGYDEGGLFAHLAPAPTDIVEGMPIGPPPSTAADGSYQLVDTPEKFDAFVAELKLQKRFAFDTETDDLGAMKSNLVGMSFSWAHQTGHYVAIRTPTGAPHIDEKTALEILRPILEDEAIAKVGHNIKYDLLVMRKAGVTLRGIELDSMIGTGLVDATRNNYGIDSLALSLLNYRKIATSELLGKGRMQLSMDRVEPQRVATYASEDADISLRLADLAEEKLKDLPSVKALAVNLETPLIEVIAEMEFNGIAIDQSVLKEQSVVITDRIETLHAQIMSAAGCDFNPDSPKQLAEILFDKLKLKKGKKTKSGYSTDVQVLERLSLEHECPRLLLEYRQLTKLKNTYVDNLPEYVNSVTHRIHPSFSQLGAETGRLSCSDPNLQNIPIRTDIGRRIRLAFVPGDREKNVLLAADYSQIELRMLAHFTGEPGLVKAFESDEDVHKAVAAEVFNIPLDQVTREQRGYAKIVNFGIIYGVTAFGLAQRIEGLNQKAAQELIVTYNKRFPTIARFFDKCVMDAQTNGYVETILGRRRGIPDIDSGVIALRNYASRAAINSVVQGSAADLIKQAMLNVYRRLAREGRPSRMLLQVHDELIFETPIEAVEADSAMIRQEMVNAMKLRVPLKVEIGVGKSWGEAK